MSESLVFGECMAKGICFAHNMAQVTDENLTEHSACKVMWAEPPQEKNVAIVPEQVTSDAVAINEMNGAMAAIDPFPTDVDQVRATMSGISNIIFEREEHTKALVCAYIAKTTGIMYGDPGQAKSDLIRVVSQSFDRSYWNTTISAFTSLDDLVGPYDLLRMREEKVWERSEMGMLTHDIIFLDEIGNSSAAVRDAIKTIINERTFQNGERMMELPLQSVIAASNSQLIDTDATESAFADRFLVRLKTSPIQDPKNVARMLRGRYGRPEVVRLSSDVMDRMQNLVRSVEMSDEFFLAAESLRRQIKADGAAGALEITDRRMYQVMDLAAAHALINGRKKAKRSDLIVFGWTFWSNPETEMLPLQEYLKMALMNNLTQIEEFRAIADQVWRGWREIIDNKELPLASEDVMKIGINNRNELQITLRTLQSLRPKLEDQDETDAANKLEADLNTWRSTILLETENYSERGVTVDNANLDALKKG